MIVEWLFVIGLWFLVRPRLLQLCRSLAIAGCCPECTLHDAICYGRLWQVLQVLMPGIAFGLAHASYLNQGFLVWLAIMLPTALLGMLWGVAYLLRRRSLVPTIVAHSLNDATESPWGYFRGGKLP